MSLVIKKTKDRIASKEYREYLSNCCACAVCAGGPCDPAHTVNRGRADGSDLTCIPLCRRDHKEYDNAGKGKTEWLAKRGVNLETYLLYLETRFRKQKGLSLSGTFEEVARDAGFIQAPYTKRKNRHQRK